jgi:uroporphyrinogen III methyltransferase / synthase
VGELVPSSLRGKRVVVTRAAEQSEALIEILRKKGAVPISLPLITFSPADDSAKLDESLRRLDQYDWVFFTSQNAVRAMVERCLQLKLDLAVAMEKVGVAAVGPATQNAAHLAGLKVVHVAVNHNGTSLARELAEQVKEKSVLLPRSDRANPELVEVLQKLGAQVTEIIAYKTDRPTPQTTDSLATALRGGVDAIMFFSPSAVHHFEEVAGRELFLKLSQTAAFLAIGPVTKKTLRAMGVERVFMAEDTTAIAAVASLENIFVQAALTLPAGAKHG